MLAGLYAAVTGAPSDAPVLLIHGAFGSHLSWPAELRRMPGTQVVALDLPGHGRSTGQGHWTVQAYADAVRRFWAEFEPVPMILIGHSLGGAIALNLALAQPSRVAGLVLIGTGAKLRVHPSILDGIVQHTEVTAHQLADLVWSANPPPAARERTYDEIMALNPLLVRGDFEACNGFDMMDRLDTMLTPALIMVGSEDRMTPPHFSEYLATHLYKSELVIVPGAGHMLPLEQPAAVAAAIATWRQHIGK